MEKIGIGIGIGLIIALGVWFYQHSSKLRYIQPCPHGFISESKCPICKVLKS